MARRRTRRRLRRRGRGNSSGKRPGLRQPTIKEAMELARLFAGTQMGKELVKYVNNKFTGKSPVTPAKTITLRARRRGVTFGGTVNVKADSERTTSTFYKQKVTKQQQRKINKRFKNDNASKVQYENDYAITETIPQQTNSCKWIWFSHNNLAFIQTCWNNFAPPAQLNSNFGTPNISSNALSIMANKEQAIYFSKIKSKYEIFNPTNYDMNVIIYDIVCKEDHIRTQFNSASEPIVSIKGNPTTYITNNFSNPIALMEKGIRGVRNTQGYIEVGASGTGESIYDIQFKPTGSYPFNLTWTIVGKKTVRLQPGASFNHKFTYRPKNLMSRGYYGYQYLEHLSGDGTSMLPIETPVKGFTCGSLFKVYGQISGSTDSTNQTVALETVPAQTIRDGVVNLSGRIMIKEFYSMDYYYCNPKYSYKQHTSTGTWTPDDEEELTIPTVIDMQPVADELPEQDDGVAD